MNTTTRILLLFSLIAIFSCQQTNKEGGIPPTDKLASPEARWGALFTAVQSTDIFADSKTFVDCEPKVTDLELLALYKEQKDQPDFGLKEFVHAYFNIPGQVGGDFQTDPTNSITEHIQSLWPVLTRQPDQQSNTSTLIALPNPYIVPGGRFREVYYWDSYFTMLGLQEDGQVELIENMVNNFAFLIDEVGHIPNGNRTYYLTRSQPPFFASMVGVLAEEKGDSIWTTYLPQLQKEYDFWMDGADQLSENSPTLRRVVRMKEGSILNRYQDDGDTPRPEGYKEDIKTSSVTANPSQTNKDLRSAAESGWDFSSRWFRIPDDISTIHTSEIIPVDLNALMYKLEKSIEKGYSVLGNTEMAETYAQKADARKNAIWTYCWDSEMDFFQDYDFVAGEFTGVLSLAGMYPLFFELADKSHIAGTAQIIAAQFLKAGGLVSTLNETGEQWDAPNGWAPLQYLSIVGLKNYGQEELANTIKERWLALNQRVYQNTGKMVEKYNVVDMTLEAGGGEYPTVEGFGWSNGVYRKLEEMD
ncbi:MAG: alpha,alpha-trehalase TreF [Bacteroidota bacterium]